MYGYNKENKNNSLNYQTHIAHTHAAILCLKILGYDI